MKEIKGLIANIPEAARHKSLRWHLGYIASVTVLESARFVGEVVKGASHFVVWHVTCAAQYTREAVGRWLRSVL